MTIYLTIITTILVLTQIIRVTQNAISLHRFDRIDKRDVEVQKAVYYMLHEKLKKEIDINGQEIRDRD